MFWFCLMMDVFFIRNFIESASNCTRCTRCGRHKRTRLVGGVCVKCVNKRHCLDCQFYKSKRYFSAGRERCNGCIRQAGGSRQAVGHTFVEVDLPLPPDSTEITASIRLHEADIIRQISEEIEINGWVLYMYWKYFQNKYFIFFIMLIPWEYSNSMVMCLC